MLDRQAKIERALKKKNKFVPVDFREKDTMRKIMYQWNRMTTAQKNRVSIEQLDYVLDMAESNIRPDLFKEVSRIYNRKVSQTYKELTPAQKAQRTREANKRAKEELKQLYIKSAVEKAGARQGKELFTKLGKDIYIPNPKMIGKELDEIIEERLKNNKRAGANKKDEVDLIAQTKKDYKKFKKAVEEFGGEKEAKRRINEINRESLKDVKGLLFGYIDATGKPRGGYFKNAIQETNEEIEAYLKQLTVQQRYKIQDVLLSNKFMGLYDSNQESPAFDENFMEKRQQDLLKILRNETGMIMYEDKLGRKRFKKDKNPSKSTYYTIANFI